MSRSSVELTTHTTTVTLPLSPSAAMLPRAALAWNIDSERFMQNQNTVSALKLRLSLGEVGNSNVPTSGSYSQLYGTNYSFGTIETIGQSSLSIANENLSWETTREVNAGLEVGLWNDRLKFTADFYDKVTRDLLLEAPVVNIVGFDKAWQNIGKMRNRGIEGDYNNVVGLPVARLFYEMKKSGINLRG